MIGSAIGQRRLLRARSRRSAFVWSSPGKVDVLVRPVLITTLLRCLGGAGREARVPLSTDEKVGPRHHTPWKKPPALPLDFYWFGVKSISTNSYIQTGIFNAVKLQPAFCWAERSPSHTTPLGHLPPPVPAIEIITSLSEDPTPNLLEASSSSHCRYLECSVPIDIS